MTSQTSPADPGTILVVEDNEVNRDLLLRTLTSMGHKVFAAANGREALELLMAHEIDLLLLDIMMPEMNGYQVLEHMRQNAGLRHIPVIVISTVSDLDSVIRCIELGAEDYLFKPFDRVFLKARISACLEKKRLHDQEKAYLLELQTERERSERLLLNVLPLPIAERLKKGDDIVADRFEEVTVLFADIVDFTSTWDHRPPVEMVKVLNGIFSCFDQLAQRHGIEKIKTIGDAYMVVGGVPTARADHAETVAAMALDMLDEINQFCNNSGEPYQLRIGIDTGPVVAGVIGTRKFSYDLWGDTVNTASRMQRHGLANRIQVTAATYRRLEKHYLFEERGLIAVKGKGEMTTYLLNGRKHMS